MILSFPTRNLIFLYYQQINYFLMKKIILIPLFFLSFIVNSQVGINTDNPVATLDVKEKPTDTNFSDGITAPRLTLTQLYNKGEYDTEETSAIIYITDATLTLEAGINRQPSLEAIREVGFYVFDGILWNALEARAGSVTFIGASYYTNPLAPKEMSINGEKFFIIGFRIPPLLNIGGGVWDNTTNSYQIPVTGNYLINLSFRSHDNLNPVIRFYLSVSDTIEVDSNGVWFSSSKQRTGYFYNKIAYLTKGTKIYPYFRTPDKNTNSLWQAFFTVSLLNEE